MKLNSDLNKNKIKLIINLADISMLSNFFNKNNKNDNLTETEKYRNILLNVFPSNFTISVLFIIYLIG